MTFCAGHDTATSLSDVHAVNSWIHTPTLREQIADCPGDLQYLAEFIARRVLTDLPDESHALARETVDGHEMSQTCARWLVVENHTVTRWNDRVGRLWIESVNHACERLSRES